MALIKCTECGHMISDKATKCPKCGCPTKVEMVRHQDNVARDMPVCDEKESHTNKWLYVVIALLLAAIAGGGYWWYSQSKGDQEARQLVEQFAKAVETGDNLVIHNLYPNCNADSLVFKYDKNNIQIERKENEWLVKEADDVVLIIVKNEDNTIKSKSLMVSFLIPIVC